MSKQEKENVKTDVKTVTDKESGATAIYHVVKADLIHSGATEEIAELGAMKAMCAFETAWSMSVEKACKWLRENTEYWLGDYNLADDELEDNQVHYAAMIEELRKSMEE